MSLDSSQQIKSTHDLVGLQMNGDSGVALMPPSKASPSTGKGQHWAIPLPAGETTVEVFANDDILVQWQTPTESGQEAIPQSSAVRIANSWTMTFNLSEISLVEVVTDVDAHLIVSHGDSGKTSLLGEEGNYLSKHFIAPSQSGNLSFSNPNQNAATITWKNGGISVPANQTIEVEWPPSNIDSAAILESSENVLIQWKLNDNGMTFLPAIDTGQITGLNFIEDNSQSIINYSSQYGDYQSKLAKDGNTGILTLEDDGAMRCIAIDQTASGWISTTPVSYTHLTLPTKA